MPTDRLLFDMIRDNTALTIDNSKLLGRLSGQVSMALAEIAKLNSHVMHLSKQGIGHTERLRRLEAGQVAKKEETLWSATLELFSPRQRVTLLLLAVLVVAGVLEPAQFKTWLLTLIGLPPS